MTIDKAIEILSEIARARSFTRSQDPTDAIKLGIEALKLVKKCRHSPNSWFVKELPGETEE